jgi:hypothetical protein
VGGRKVSCDHFGWLRGLRYVGLRLLKSQGVLFKDGADRHFHAVVTNRKLDGGRLLDWHREKAGTVEHTHDEVNVESIRVADAGDFGQRPEKAGWLGDRQFVVERPHYRMRNRRSVSTSASCDDLVRLGRGV